MKVWKMMDDVSDIQSYYDERTEGEMERLERHQLEYDITWRYLEKYLPRKGNILEIGCGPGTITIGLAKRGYRVSAVDLSEKMIDLALKRVSEEGLKKNVLLYVKDARDLGEIKQDDFDAALMMGPLYHLVHKEDRETALKEAHSRLKPGGIIFSAYISRYGIWGDLIKNIPEVIERQDDVRSILDEGKDLPAGPPEGIGFRAYFTTIPEITPLHEEIGFETLVLASSEPCISADDESYNRLEGKRKKMWMDLLYELSTEESIIAASRHLLYIGRKPK
ncbi:class I SAM-dependent methyltransferase [Chloroflexota bacterium]